MSELLNALRRNLANQEEIGDEATAKLLRKRIADEEKAEAAPAPVVADAPPDKVIKTTKKGKA